MSGDERQLGVSDHSRDSAGLTYVYPVVSRRAGGVSIGINLNPNNACNWRCIYCQVPDLRRGASPSIDLALLERELRGFIDDLLHGDFMRKHVPEGSRKITDVAFSGNGEPTSAREFPEAVALVGRVLRDAGLDGKVKIRVITNGSLLGRGRVRQGLRLLGELGGEAWFKVDAGTAEGFRRINNAAISPESVVRNLRRCAKLCPTWVQTCIFALDGEGPAESELLAYLDLLARAAGAGLAGVHLYGLARPSMQPETKRLSNLPEDRLEEIAARVRGLGLSVRVSP
ncbi:MAG: radical SAM protein [Rhodocyclaceae bacterium]|jgi:wyosine [tRNA(Phe)-imidazoG37] synthetase (radical SAM superfamily)